MFLMFPNLNNISDSISNTSVNSHSSSNDFEKLPIEVKIMIANLLDNNSFLALYNTSGTFFNLINNNLKIKKMESMLEKKEFISRETDLPDDDFEDEADFFTNSTPQTSEEMISYFKFQLSQMIKSYSETGELFFYRLWSMVKYLGKYLAPHSFLIDEIVSMLEQIPVSEQTEMDLLLKNYILHMIALLDIGSEKALQIVEKIEDKNLNASVKCRLARKYVLISDSLSKNLSNNN